SMPTSCSRSSTWPGARTITAPPARKGRGRRGRAGRQPPSRKRDGRSTGSPPHLREDRLRGRLDECRAGGEDVDRGGVLEAVAGEDADDGRARRELDVRQRRETRRRRRLAEEPLAARDLEPGVGDLL